MDRLTYAGTAQGQVFVKVIYSTAAESDVGHGIGSYPNVELATSSHQGTFGGSCWGSAIERHETAQATAWIDVGARLPSACIGVALEDCAPQATDPQGQGTSAIRDFEQNYLDIVLKDP